MKKNKIQFIVLLAVIVIISMIVVFMVEKIFKRESKASTSANVAVEQKIEKNEEAKNIVENNIDNENNENLEVQNNVIENNVEENKAEANQITNNNTTTNTTTSKNTTVQNKTTQKKTTTQNKTTQKKTTTKKTTEKTTTAKTTTEEKRKAENTSSSSEKGVIYLTIDDGPSTDITPKMLDILKEENVKATFFILNYNSTGEKIVKREVAEGHAVGIHGYSHDYKTIYKSDEAYMNNLNKLQAKIKESTGITSKITRFPGGSSNTVSKKYSAGIMSRLVKLVEKNGYKYYDWNISSGDAGGAKTSQAVYKNVTKGLSKKKANVVLIHDFSGNTKTLNALRDIIQYGKSNGYEFRTLSYDSSLVCHHGVNN